MLDIKFIRENSDLIKSAAQKKRLEFDADALLALDDKRREMQKRVEDKRAEQNAESDRVAGAGSEEERRSIISRMQILKAEREEYESRLKEVMIDWQKMMLQVPNIPDVSVPEGADDSENLELRKWGEPAEFSFQPKSHIEIMEKLGMLDLERGSKVAGFRGYYLKGDGVLLSMAVWQLAVDFFGKKGFELLMTPAVVGREFLMGTGYLPQSEDDLYKTQDKSYLIGTSEVPVMGYHSGEILDKKDLPKKYLAFSPCYRREAGSHGKDVKGLIRVHEFFKWEQVVLCKAEHDESVRVHEWLNRNTEEFIELLNIPYHTVANCGGDLGLGQVKKYDIELWVSGENTYREISSASYFHDFQTRRLNIRYRDAEGNMRFPHSLNSTAIPTPRILVSIIENYQQQDGTIKVPEALVPYVGKKVISAVR